MLETLWAHSRPSPTFSEPRGRPDRLHPHSWAFYFLAAFKQPRPGRILQPGSSPSESEPDSAVTRVHQSPERVWCRVRLESHWREMGTEVGRQGAPTALNLVIRRVWT